MSIESHNLDRPNIETSVVGNFPLPKWLTQSASQEAILDAIKATIKD